MNEQSPAAAEDVPAPSGRRIGGEFIRQAILGEVTVPQGSPLRLDSRGARLTSAIIEGSLDLSAVSFDRPIVFEGCTFEASINLTRAKLEGFTLIGCRAPAIEAYGAEISGDLRLDDTRLDNPGRYAFNGAAMRVGCSVLFINGFAASGAVSLANATIAGRVVCNGTFSNPIVFAPGERWYSPIRSALNGFGAKIGALAFNTPINPGTFCAEGPVVFTNASIGTGVYVLGGSFTAGLRTTPSTGAESISDLSTRYMMLAGSALHLHNVQMGELVFTNIARFEGMLSLRAASATTVADDGTVWQVPGARHARPGVAIDLDGFRYNSFTNSFAAVTDTSWRTRLEWLKTQVKDELRSDVKVQPYTQCAEVLHNMGDVRGSRMILFERERMRLRTPGIGIWERLSGHALGLFAGHGYKSYYALYWAIGVWLAGGAVFSVADRLGEMRPASELIVVEDSYQRTGHIPQDYEPLKPLLFSADTLLPIVDLNQKHFWLPRDAGERPPDAAAVFPRLPHSATRALNWLFGGWLPKFFYYFETVMGWLLVSIVIAGISGNLSRDREE